ncbi:MAG: T9SS type A sorting domain-containing protein [Bacteroidota bacterium]
MRLATLLLALLVAPTAAAQFNCPTSTTTNVLEGNDVRARLYANGNLFWQGGDPLYEVPKDSSVQAIFAAGLWMGGFVDDTLRFAGADYSDWEFRPGPLDDFGQPLADASAYDRIWHVTLADIARYNATGEATDDLASWPAEVGAPVVDGDGDPDNYNLAGGDRPAISGDETAWWIMNDVACPHTWSNREPLGVELRASAFTFSADYTADLLDDPAGTGGVTQSLVRVLRHATFYRFAITNRSTEPIERFYAGLFVDTDLGDFNDDYIGSAPELGMGYVYNGDDFDEGGYEADPPAFGAVYLQGLTDSTGADLGLSTFLTYNGDSSNTGNPTDGEDAYNYLQARWRDDNPLTFGGNGYNPGSVAEETRYMFPDPPPRFWSEYNTDGVGSANQRADRRFLTSSGPATLAPGATQTLLIGLLWSRTQTPGTGNLASVRQLYLDAPLLGVVRTLSTDPRLQTITPETLPAPYVEPEPPPDLPDRLAVSDGFPNPFTRAASFSLDLSEALPVRAVAYDLLGREVAVLQDGELPGGTHTLALDGARLPAGVYVVRIAVGSGSTTRTVVKL